MELVLYYLHARNAYSFWSRLSDAKGREGIRGFWKASLHIPIPSTISNQDCLSTRSLHCANTLPDFYHTKYSTFHLPSIHLFSTTSLIWRVFLSPSLWYSNLNSSWLLENNRLLSKNFLNGKSTHDQDILSWIRATVLLTFVIRIIYSDRCTFINGFLIPKNICFW